MRFYIFSESPNKIEKEKIIERHDEGRIESSIDIDVEKDPKMQKSTKQTKNQKPSEGIRYDCTGHWPEIDSKKKCESLQK